MHFSLGLCGFFPETRPSEAAAPVGDGKEKVGDKVQPALGLVEGDTALFSQWFSLKGFWCVWDVQRTLFSLVAQGCRSGSQ